MQIWGFISSTISLVIIFAASAAPIPLYAHYADAMNLTKGQLSLTAVMYFVSTVIALVFLARISNYYGRKISIYIVLLLGIIGCLSFIFVNSIEFLLLGRFMQGLACGLASSSIIAFIIDNEPPHLKGLATSIGSAGPNFGLAVGAVICGITTQRFPDVLNSIFIILISLLLICFILIILSKETMPPQKGIFKSFIPQIKAPNNIRKLLLPAGATFAASWSVGGFYQAYSATIAIQIFHLNDTFMASLAFVSFIAPIALGAAITQNLNPFKAQRYGTLGFVLSLILLYLCLFSENIVYFFLISILAGIFQGILFTGSMKTIMERTTIQDRAGVLSLIYIISYSGAAIPNFVVSQIAYLFDLTQLTLGYVLLSIVCFIILLISTKK